jgi:hypothetical protein
MAPNDSADCRRAAKQIAKSELSWSGRSQRMTRHMEVGKANRDPDDPADLSQIPSIHLTADSKEAFQAAEEVFNQNSVPVQ